MMKGQEPEFSRVISVTRIPPKDIEEALEAKPAERMALAKRFGLVSLNSLKAHLTLVLGAQQAVEVTGRIEATVVQNCVVTLEPITSHLEIDVNMVLVPGKPNDVRKLEDDELNDEIEYYADGKIDIGEQVAQQLGISIDPYPRKAHASIGTVEFGKKVEKERPFAKLATAIKAKKNKGKR
ncbi:MAG: DUF177 domain-containing protein [Bdellovibrionales bacterium]|jgi:uncharacterized metal-binding protein YceD (DUF177 family)